MNPPSDTLIKLASAQLKWFTANIHNFTPWKGGDLDKKGGKAFNEFSLLYSVLRRFEGMSLFASLCLSEHLRLWEDHLIGLIEAPQYRELAMKYPIRSFDFCAPYFLLRYGGYRSDYYERVVKRVKHYGFPRMYDDIPYKIIERDYFIWKSGLINERPKRHKLYTDTVTADIRSTVHVDVQSAFCVTHTLFYLTDYGSYPMPVSETEITRLCDIVNALIIHYFRIGNWDMVGELLINLISLDGYQQSFLAALVAKQFILAPLPDGSLSPYHRHKAILESAKDEAEYKANNFRYCYHTTMQSLIFCVLAIENNESYKSGHEAAN